MTFIHSYYFYFSNSHFTFCIFTPINYSSTNQKEKL